MNLIELDHALRKLRLSGMADVLETRLRHAQTEKLAPIDIVSTLFPTSFYVARTASLSVGSKKPAFGTPSAPSTASTSISTRK
jgi:hypothetical protein